ncbi:hypothetical protein LINGRAHAP2_LOCUS10416 [Linum grandiflorum]
MDNLNHQTDDCVEVGSNDIWPEVIDDFLMDTMIDEMKKGNLVTSTFSKIGWASIKNALKLKFTKEYTDKQLTNKYSQWRQRYKNFIKLLSYTGMGYTASNRVVNAELEV